MNDVNLRSNKIVQLVHHSLFITKIKKIWRILTQYHFSGVAPINVSEDKVLFPDLCSLNLCRYPFINFKVDLSTQLCR